LTTSIPPVQKVRMGEAKLLLPKFALFELTVGTLALVELTPLLAQQSGD